MPDYTLKTQELSAALETMAASGDIWLTPFQESRWTQAWQLSLGSGQGFQTVTVVLSEGSQPVVILPLAITIHRGVRCLGWQADPVSDYCAPVVRQSHLEKFARIDGTRLFQQICAELGGIDLVYLRKQPVMVGHVANPFIFAGSTKHHAGAHVINFGGAENWDIFLAHRRSAGTRQGLRKKQRGLEKLGRVTFSLAATPQEARALIEECLACKSRQLAELGHWDPFTAPGIRRFVVDYFSDGIGASNWAVALNLDGSPVATAFGFVGRDGWLLYQMAMSGEHVAMYSPGTQLLMRLMQHCIETGVARLDLSLGDEAYKFEWCDQHETLLTTTLPLSIKGRIAHQLIRLGAGIQLSMAANQDLYHAGKRLKRLLGKVGTSVITWAVALPSA